MVSGFSEIHISKAKTCSAKRRILLDGFDFHRLVVLRDSQILVTGPLSSSSTLSTSGEKQLECEEDGRSFHGDALASSPSPKLFRSYKHYLLFYLHIFTVFRHIFLSPLLSSSSAAPLLFFTLASLLSFLAVTKSSGDSSYSSASPSPPPPLPDGDYSVAAFRALATDHIWSLDAPLRDARWRSLYGLSYPVFTTVVEKLKPFITASNLSLPADYAVAMVLSRLAHGCSAKTLASRYSLEPYLISKITNMVTRLLATKLYPEFIKIPVGKRRLIETTQGFEELTSLPNICGAIDSTPVKLRRRTKLNPRNIYGCKYGYDAVLLQVVADHKKIFWDVCVKAPGGEEDSSHFRDSLLYKRLTSGDIVWEKVINVRGHHVRPYIVGDWCYPLLSFLMTPFSPNGSGSPPENLFDGMLMKGRSVVVEAIGLLKARWKILRSLNVGVNHAPQTIVACCVLHNLCQIAREPEPEIWKDPDEAGSPARVLESERQFYYYGQSLRQALADDLHQRLSSR